MTMTAHAPRILARVAPKAALVALSLILLPIAACAPIVNSRGNIPDPDALAEVKPGVQTREQVISLLGTPSNVSTFDDRTWYYISRKTETVAFFKPEPIDQQIVVVTFDDKGVVSTVEKREGLDGAQEVALVDRTTPTAGHSFGLLEQLFGNIGRFTPATGGGKLRGPASPGN